MPSVILGNCVQYWVTPIDILENSVNKYLHVNVDHIVFPKGIFKSIKNDFNGLPSLSL